MRLLVTRPVPDGERTATTLRARGHDVMVGPLLHIEALPQAKLGAGPWAGLLLTSANAVRALAQHARGAEFMRLPAFAVGQRTAEAAKAAGFAEVVSADGSAVDLALLIVANARAPTAPLLYLAGQDRAADLAAAVAARGVPVETAIIYRAVAATHFPPFVWSAFSLGQLDGVLHFSRRSAETYVICAKDTGVFDKAKAVFHYCLSSQVAVPLAEAGATKIEIAHRPEEGALIDLVDAACSKI
jgi:uroporphyrinogen-III synthase